MTDGLREHVLEFLIGALFVVQFAYKRFDDPPTQKYSTTSRQYHTAWAMYTLLWLGCWLILSSVPAVLTQFLGISAPYGVKALNSPLAIALAFTALLAQFPILKDFELALRKFFWEKASIPHEARELAHKLTSGPYLSPPKVLEKVGRQWPFLNTLAACTPPGEILPCVKIASLWTEVREWQESRRYANFTQTISSQLRELRFRSEDYLADAEEFYHCKNAGKDAGTRLPRRVEFAERMLTKKLMLLVAQGIVYCEHSDFERRRELKRLGFSVELDPTADSHILIAIFLALLLMFSVCFTIIAGQGNMIPPLERIVGAGRIALTSCLAVGAAILFRRKTHAGENDVAILSRIPSYSVSALAAVGCWLAVSLLDFYLERGTQGPVLGHLSRTFPYALMPLTIAAVTAVLMDYPGGSRAWLRDGLILAGSCIVATTLTLVMLRDVGQRPYYVTNLFMSALVGLLVGMLIPSWYRKENRNREDHPGRASAADSIPSASRAGSERNQSWLDNTEDAVDAYS